MSLQDPVNHDKMNKYDEFMLATKTGLIRFRSYTLEGVGLGGLPASDGVGWVNVLDGQQQSGQNCILRKATCECMMPETYSSLRWSSKTRSSKL